MWDCRLFPPISGSAFTSCEVPGNTICLLHHTSILKCSARVPVWFREVGLVSALGFGVFAPWWVSSTPGEETETQRWNCETG